MIFHQNIIELTQKNSFFRKEVITGNHSQVVLMALQVGEDIGEETHKVDQIFFFVEGTGQAIINGVTTETLPNQLVLVPSGTKHNFKNTGTQVMKLFTIYAPAQHKPGTVEKTKGKEY